METKLTYISITPVQENLDMLQFIEDFRKQEGLSKIDALREITRRFKTGYKFSSEVAE